MEMFWGVFPLAKQWCNSARGVCGRPGLISNESWHCLGDWRQMHLCFKTEVMDNIDWCSFYFQRCGFTLLGWGKTYCSVIQAEDWGRAVAQEFCHQKFCCMTLSELLNTYWENMVRTLPIENWKVRKGGEESKKTFSSAVSEVTSCSWFRISITVFDGIQSLRSVGGTTWTGNVHKLVSVLRNQNNLADCTGDSKKQTEIQKEWMWNTVLQGTGSAWKQVSLLILYGAVEK